MSTVSIQTTQNIDLEYEIASVGERILAYLLDNVICGAWFFLTFMILGTADLVTPVFLILIVSLPILLYHLISEIFFNGQSIGKRTLNIRVLKKDGTQPSLGNYFMRWIFRLIECTMAFGSIALITILFNGKGQRLGDIAAGTTVVRTRRKTSIRDVTMLIRKQEDHLVTYQEVLALSDRDIATIKKILRKSVRSGNYQLLVPLAEKIKEITGIQTELPEYEFLETVVKDYHELAGHA